MNLTRTIILGISLLASVLRPSALAATEPAREIYVVPFSHLDLWWAGTEEECLSRGNRVIQRAMQLCQADPSFRFLIEADIFLANYADSHKGTADLAELKTLVRQGRIEISPKWDDIMADLPDGEVLTRDFAIGRKYAHDEFGVDPQTAHLADLPGFPTQLAQILRLTRTPNVVITRGGPNSPLFRLKSPDGSEALTWFSTLSYGWGAALGLHGDLNPQRLGLIASQIQLMEAATSAPLMMHWGSDLYAPSARLLGNIPKLNEAFRGRFHFRLATIDEYFTAVGGQADLPELAGEIPNCWPNIVSSIPNLWPATIPATSTLESAEKFAAIDYALGYADYPDRQLNFLWRRLVETCDHNQDGQGGFKGDKEKEDYTSLVLYQSGEILKESLRNLAERVKIPPGAGAAIVVFNQEGWTRDDSVRTHVTVYGDVQPSQIDDYRRGVRLVDETGASVPFSIDSYSENGVSRAYEISFVAHSVPSLGYKAYYLKPAEAPPADQAIAQAAEITLDSSKDRQEPRRPVGSDTMENAFYRVEVDKANGFISVFDKELGVFVTKEMQIVAREERGGNYVALEPLSGRTIPETIDTVSVEENNPVCATLRIQGELGDVPVTQRLTLFKELKRIDVQDTIAWSKARYWRVEQLVPWQIKDPKVQYGVPFGSNDAGNVLPTAQPRQTSEISRQTWMNSRMIQNWISAAGTDWELTVAVDHPFVRLENGILCAQMLHGTRSTSVRVVKNGEAASMQYPQPGVYTFRYALTSGRGNWLDRRSYRFGSDFNNPLLPVSTTDELSQKELPGSHSFLGINNPSVVLSALKKEDNGPGLIARFYEVEGKAGPSDLSFDETARPAQPLNLLEEPTEKAQSGFRPFEIKTLRIAKP